MVLRNVPSRAVSICFISSISQIIITKMIIRIHPLLRFFALVFLLPMVIFSSGCINAVPAMLGWSDTEGVPPYEDEYVPFMDAAPLNYELGGETGYPPIPEPSPIATLAVEEVSAIPYVTQDPYRLPYRDHGNRSTVDAVRIKKIPQYSKSFVLRSNATAVKVQVPRAPLVIDLTFSPRWDSPDQTTGASGSFVYSKALVTVHRENSSAILEQEGYGSEYSTGKEKRITLYREGTFIITLSGDFMDVKMEVTSGEGAPVPPASAIPVSPVPEEDEYW